MIPFYRSLRPLIHHGALPRPANWQVVFGNSNPIELEIGFGNGEYLAKLVEGFPKTNFIGFEQYCERIQRTLRKLSRTKGGNVRVFRLDVRAGLERYIGPTTLTHVHCLYPPPWPKKSDAKHRLLTTEFLKLVNSRLVDGGGMTIVTDHNPYALWIKDNVPGSGFDLNFKTIPASYGTKFERKWFEGGQREFYQLSLTKREHKDIRVKEDVVMQTYVIKDFNPERFVCEGRNDKGVTAAFKDFLYDPKRKTGLVHMIVVDEQIQQNIRIIIIETPAGWRINLAEGTLFMPTEGVAQALACVHEAALRSAQ